jgi:hypothetical protein
MIIEHVDIYKKDAKIANNWYRELSLTGLLAKKVLLKSFFLSLSVATTNSKSLLFT